MACQDQAGGKIFDKKTIIESIESMGCQKRGEENFDKKKIIESMGCQEMGKKLIEKTSLKAWVAKKARGGEEKSLKASVAKKGGWEKLSKTKSLKAWVAKKGGGENVW